MEEKKTEKLLEKYQAGNKAIRQRLLLLALFWTIIFGLFLIRQKETEKWNMSMESERALKWMLESPDSVLKELDSLDFDNPILPGLFMIGNYVENWDTLSESFYSSKYMNKAPVKRALFELNRKRATIFQQSTISFFGVQLTFDPWYYLGLLVILILLHDLTRVILFQKSLKSILIRENVEQWEFGFEQPDYFVNSADATSRFIRVISSLLFGVISLSPIAAAVLSTQLGPAWEQPGLFLEIANDFLLFLIVIHTAIIFYSENIFRTKNLVDFLTSKGAKPNIDFYVIWSSWFVLSSILCLTWALIYPEYPSAVVKAVFTIFILLQLMALPVSIWLSAKNPESKFARGLTFASIWLICAAILVYYHGETHFSSGIFEDYTKKFGWYLAIISIATGTYLRFRFPGRKS